MDSVLQTSREVIEAKMKFIQCTFLFANILIMITANTTPISLEYKPFTSFYVPYPFIYPQPMIPPGTPWPAFSTTVSPTINTFHSAFPSKTTLNTVEGTTKNIPEVSTQSVNEETVFNLLCSIIPCPSTSNPLLEEKSKSQNGNFTSSLKGNSSDKMEEVTSLPNVSVPTKTDISIKPVNNVFHPDMIIFPDQLAASIISNKIGVSNMHVEQIKDKLKPLADKDAISKPLSSTITNLEYKPSRPSHVPDPVIYPQPAIAPENTKPLSTTTINSEYKPTVPTFVPNPVVHPQSSMVSSKPIAEKDTTSKPTTTLIVNLEYIPSRPPFVPDPFVYPQPAIMPDNTKPLSTTTIDYKPTVPTFVTDSIVHLQPSTVSSKPVVEKDTTSEPMSTTIVNLEYKPSRPPFVPDPFIYPLPAIMPDNTKPLSTTINYKPTIPTIVPDPAVYPQPSIVSTKPLAEGTTSKPMSTTIVNLEYKPSRPPFVPDPFVYPQPVIVPDNTKPLSTTINYKPTIPTIVPDPAVYPQPSIVSSKPLAEGTTSKPMSTTIVNLEYKPSRPPYMPDPFVYPQPAIVSASSKPVAEIDASSKAPSATTVNSEYTLIPNTESPAQNENDITTRRIVTTTKPTNNKYSTPISLEYKPSRSPYVPNPVFYPQPAIPPGTPWPAFSTTKPFLPNQNLV